MKKVTESFTPSEGVTMENALEYLAAIEDAVRCQITILPREERSMMVGIIAGALAQTAESLKRFRSDLESSGRATPVTEEQMLRLRMMFRLAREKDKPES